jgi:hypothetical protein
MNRDFADTASVIARPSAAVIYWDRRRLDRGPSEEGILVDKRTRSLSVTAGPMLDL